MLKVFRGASRTTPEWTLQLVLLLLGPFLTMKPRKEKRRKK
jgi:hypothetical protein